MSKPKLSVSSFYPTPPPEFPPFTSTGSVFAILMMICIGFVLVFRYQEKQLVHKGWVPQAQHKYYDKINKEAEEAKQLQDENLRSMEQYYMAYQMHPQQKVHQAILQNNPRELEKYVDESIALRASKPRHIV